MPRFPAARRRRSSLLRRCPGRSATRPGRRRSPRRWGRPRRTTRSGRDRSRAPGTAERATPRSPAASRTSTPNSGGQSAWVGPQARSTWWISTSPSRIPGTAEAGNVRPPGTRSTTVSQASSGIAAIASVSSVVAPRKRVRSSLCPVAASASMSASRRSCEAYIGTGSSCTMPPSTPARPSALSVRCATTWARVQPGSRLGPGQASPVMPSTVRTSLWVASWSSSASLGA